VVVVVILIAFEPGEDDAKPEPYARIGVRHPLVTPQVDVKAPPFQEAKLPYFLVFSNFFATLSISSCVGASYMRELRRV
jgi:hypothetical protein